MVSSHIAKHEADLRRRVSRFLGNGTPGKQHLVEVLREIRDRRWTAYVFGGVLRDLMVSGPSAAPRDVDIVVAGVSTDEMAAVFGDRVKRRTRFGGLHLDYNGWLFDVWPLGDTWAFRQGVVRSAGFSTLPRTTFLNVEAAVVSLGSRRGHARPMYSKGFFEGFSNQVVEINLEENPFPLLCVVRSLITAARLQFKLGPKLAGYVFHHGGHATVEELVETQRAHYGRVHCDVEELRTWLIAIAEQLRHSKNRPVSLPVVSGRQLQLWADAEAGR